MVAYYNEFDKHAAAWLRELIKEGLIADGEVDERSICDVSPADLAGFEQCHFFAGIGGWSLALRQAGWPDNRPVWSGSCPCQPFSSAGQRKGFADERHLWPDFFRLIEACRPVTVFGEQVASKDGLAWLDTVRADLEKTHYSWGGADLCAAGFGAPHIRQRLYWVADANSNRCNEGERDNTPSRYRDSSTTDGDACRLADSESGRQWSRRETIQGKDRGRGTAGRMGNSDKQGSCRSSRDESDEKRRTIKDGSATTSGIYDSGLPDPTNGFWRDPDWLWCRDNRWRPVESGSSPLAHGIPHRTPLLRGYGNAIVVPQAAAFIEAYMEIDHENLLRR